MAVQKKILLLGGLRYLLPVIEEAHKMGVYVITADYLPDNIAHKYSDAYCNVSITDKEAVLAEARRLQIDGILSFAVDPGVVAAAYVAEKMGLPSTCSYNAARILQDKSLFRAFLAENGIQTPWAISAEKYSDIEGSISDFPWPVIVKPVDSAGSKGVRRVDAIEDLQDAFVHALENSMSKKVIVEEFIPKDGCSYGAELFVQNGKIVFSSFYDQLFDEQSPNPYVPYAECWPSTIPVDAEKEILTFIQKICNILKVSTGIFNVECRKSTSGKAYLMELSPRAGGNRLAEMIRYAMGSDIIRPEVQKALGLPIDAIEPSKYKEHYAIYVLHSVNNGRYDGVELEPYIRASHLLTEDYYLNKGDVVQAFGGANNAIGTLFMHFADRKTLMDALCNANEWCRIKIL